MSFSRRPGARFNRGRVARRSGGGAPAYTPASEAGALLWMDAMESEAITNLISAVTYTSATPPAYNATGMGGLPAWTFDGTQYAQGADAAVLAALAGNDPSHTYLAVVQYTESDPTVVSRWVISGSTPASNDNRWAFGQNNAGSGVYRMLRRAGGTTAITSTGAPSTDPIIESWSLTGGTVEHRVNGGAADPSGAFDGGTLLDASTVTLGATETTIVGEHMLGSVAAVFLAAPALSPAALSRVLAYYSTKRGIALA